MPIPDPNSTAAIKLANELSPNETFVWVSVEPVAWAEANACIDVVDRIVAEQGGQRVLGWAFWEWPGVLIEGEFHSVWQKPDGAIVDPTPKDDGEDKILFLPDPQAVVDTWQKDNVRRPLLHRKEILDFIQMKERIYRARNRGSANSRFYEHTPYLESLYSEDERVFRKLVAKFGPPPKDKKSPN